LDEFLTLQEIIQQRKISEYKMQLAIVQNPHVKEPNKLVDSLTNAEKQYSINQPEYMTAEFNQNEFNAFKAMMASTGKFDVR
jgi:hypothetical protein